MSRISAIIRRQKDWWLLYYEKTFKRNWILTACDREWQIPLPCGEDTNIKLSERQAEYVLEELEGYALLRDQANNCQVSCFERIWESESLLEPLIVSSLDHELCSLGWDSSKRTIKLINPYTCPLVYGRSISTDLQGNPTPISAPVDATYSVSRKFALLPTDVQLTTSNHLELSSYINDLHPRHKSLYLLLSKTLSAFIPLFEHTLSDLHRNNPLPQRIPGRSWYTQWSEPEPPEFSDDEEGWALYELDMWHWMSHRPINLPDIPKDGYQGGLEERKHVVRLGGRRLQVVIGASEMRLNAGQSHQGHIEAWRVEGMKNERIVACGFFYTSEENVVNSSIEFRMAVTYPRGFNAGDNGATFRTWGMRDAAPCHQYIGNVPIYQGTAIVFPNIYQYRHTPIQLADPRKPGHRRMISFLLVDPDIPPIPSTSNVPPQQKAWIREALDSFLDVRFPEEVVTRIMDHVDWLVDEDEMVSLQEEMMQERREFISNNDDHYFSIPFDVFNGPDILLYP
ncbi:uncharacterized protein BT62DRAFT_960127 [Guyanagaster necrorhizus]|uniref:DUF4246 domain-containing protein n=1 Tax=Guyanagaster necrorhizus TaxID=856835 RepID=A0A9P7W4P9_9AGAR|nr:uncharacterized protein BT62DRAFT_960127 [Guyanagaster necrorhizus MCA 3950]KAG7452093.1 hypothetical protein BT62DRAFT_960127 [Guyanagaster necrorhizus MCA 3950]